MNFITAKRLKGLIYVITFLIMGISFMLDPTPGFIHYLYGLGIHDDAWMVMFFGASVIIAFQAVDGQYWNFIGFAPYFMYVAALVSVHSIGIASVPIATIVVHISLAFLMIIDVVVDWRTEWMKSRSS